MKRSRTCYGADIGEVARVGWRLAEGVGGRLILPQVGVLEALNKTQDRFVVDECSAPSINGGVS